jgi:hypothetical protein
MVRELLAEAHEYEGLDYKSAANPSVQRDLVELTKDFGAMSADGGYILIGAENDGAVVGIGVETARLFDEASLRGKVRRYLPDVDLHCAVHHIDGLAVAITWVNPHPKMFAIFAADGQYREKDRDVTVFRQGDVFLRRGSASVRADYRDMERLRERFVEQERTRVRREWAADLTSISAPAVTRPRIDWAQPIEEFARTAEELVRAQDTVPIRLLLAGVTPVADQRLESGDPESLQELLDRISCLAALALLIRSDWLVDESLAALSSIYDVGHQRFGQPEAAGIQAPDVWLAVAERVYALGGFAVRQQQWQAVRKLALEPGDRQRFAEMGRSWLRHSLTYAARAGLLTREVDGKTQDLSVLELAREQAKRLACLRPDRPPDDDAIFNSICQFDALGCLATVAAGRRADQVWPAFGRFYSWRTEPAIKRLIEDRAAREEVAPLSEQELADALRLISQSAHQAFWFNWDGFDSPEIRSFLAAHPPSAG